MHFKFQQSLSNYSGRCLRFRSSTECWISCYATETSTHSAYSAEARRFHGAVLGYGDAPVVVRRQVLGFSSRMALWIFFTQFLRDWVDSDPEVDSCRFSPCGHALRRQRQWHAFYWFCSGSGGGGGSGRRVLRLSRVARSLDSQVTCHQLVSGTHCIARVIV